MSCGNGTGIRGVRSAFPPKDTVSCAVKILKIIECKQYNCAMT